MTNNPTVSVIIPFHNREPLVKRAIESVLDQSYQDFELIMVDDASTDYGATVIGQIDDPRIRLISHDQNRGAGAARNTGIRAAKGKYIAFLDSDDVWLPLKLELQVALLEKQDSQTAGVVCGFTIIEQQTDRVLLPFNNKLPLLGQLEWGCILSPGSTLLVRRDVFQDIGYVNESLKRLEDWEWLIRYAEKYNFITVDEYLALIHRTTIPETDETIEACTLIYREHYKKFLAKGVAGYLRFFSTIQVERSAAYYRSKKFMISTAYLITAIILYPARNLTFYANIFNRVMNIKLRHPGKEW